MNKKKKKIREKGSSSLTSRRGMKRNIHPQYELLSHRRHSLTLCVWWWLFWVELTQFFQHQKVEGMRGGPEFHLTSIFCRPMSYLSLFLHSSSPLNPSLKGGYVYIYSKSTNASFFLSFFLFFLFFLYLNIYKESIKEVSPTTICLLFSLLKNIFKSFFLFCFVWTSWKMSFVSQHKRGTRGRRVNERRRNKENQT